MKSSLLSCFFVVFIILLCTSTLSAQHAISFNGSNGYVRVADTSGLDLSANYTMEAWVYPRTFTSLSGIISKYNSSGTNGYTMRLCQISPNTGLNVNGYNSPTGLLSVGQWFHVAVTVKDSTNITVYINGIQVSTGIATYPTLPNSDPLTFGLDYLSAPRYWNGDIDEIRLWDTVLTGSTIATWKDSTNLSSHPNYNHLAGYWNFDEGTGTVAADSRHGYNGTLMNGATWTSNTHTTPLTQTFTQVFTGNITPVAASAVAWGDYNNDGKLDLLLNGYPESGNLVSKIFQNRDSLFAEVHAGSLTGCAFGSVAWGDYDNDGNLDVLTTGYTGITGDARIYRNTGSGFTEVYAGSLPQVHHGCAAWGDFDNDGKIDIAITGNVGDDKSFSAVSKIYRNTGDGFTEVYSGSLTPLINSAVAWGDFDNDGNLDLVEVGLNPSNITLVTKFYQNTGNGFTEVYAGTVPGAAYCNIAWGDYDHDGDLDLVITGQPLGGPGISKIYQNTGSGFTEAYAGALTGVYGSSVAWGDYDNDGDLDILLTGFASGSGSTSKVYQNTGSGFVEDGTAILMPVYQSAVAWGDYDNDGDLDIFLTGNPPGAGYTSSIYRNNTTIQNTPPNMPTGLHVSVADSSATLYWNRATDSQTPQNGLTYNLRIGTTPGAIDIVSPLAEIATGHRRVAGLGDMNEDTSWTIKKLIPGQTYYWSVQALDNSYAGSQFATEHTFKLGPLNLLLNASHGSVSKNPDSSNFRYGDVVILTAIPDSGYHFVGWSGDISGLQNPDTVVINQDMNITALFSANEITMNIDDKWNLLSIPLKTSSSLKSNVFPTAISNAFAFEGSYISKDTLKNGKGYWLKFNSPQEIAQNGLGWLDSDTLSLASGWNIIGSISTPVPVSSISSNPSGIVTSQFFSYKNGYTQTDTIAPGKGYWVKVNQAGQLILNSTTFSAKKSRVIHPAKK